MYEEGVKIRLKEILLIAIFSVLVAVSRQLLIAIPSLKPVTALLLLIGAGFGRKIGAVTGIFSSVISSILVGLGSWTIFQAIAWGIIGFVGGLSGSSIYVLVPVGASVSFFYGWFTNLDTFLLYVKPMNYNTFVALCIASFSFDLVHAISTSITLVVLAPHLLKLFNKMRI
jgi:energy-coupling factor transport system substrate-specific component